MLDSNNAVANDESYLNEILLDYFTLCKDLLNFVKSDIFRITARLSPWPSTFSHTAFGLISGIQLLCDLGNSNSTSLS